MSTLFAELPQNTSEATPLGRNNTKSSASGETHKKGLWEAFPKGAMILYLITIDDLVKSQNSMAK
jgi:hypothetical protein